MKIVFFGTPHYVVPVVQALKENFDLAGVVTTPSISPVDQFALDNKIPLFKSEKLNSDVNFQLSTLNPDVFIVAAYGKIIPQNILDIPKHGSINIHPSLLPKYRGPSPLQTAIRSGDTTSAISIMQMDAEMDHGPILVQEDFEILDTDTFESLSSKVFKQSADLLVKVIPKYINGEIKPVGQNHSIATYCPRISKEDGYFDLPAGRQVLSDEFLKKLDRMIRAYHPWPGVWTKWNGKIVKFLPNVIPAIRQLTEGIQLTKSHSELDPPIKSGDDSKLLIQMEGKKPISLKDFLNGYPNFPLKNI